MVSILETVNSAKFCDLPPTQIVPMLADEGIYLASESTIYRILRARNQIKHRQKSNPKKHNKPRSLIAKAPNQVWSWDITYLPSPIRGSYFYLYMVVDVYSRKIITWKIAETESSKIASTLIKESCIKEKVARNQLTIHSDNGSPMKGATLLSTLKSLGVSFTFNRPSVSNDNPFSESLFKTLKYNRFYPDEAFDCIPSAKEWVEFFVNWYNAEHKHSGIRFVTPNQRHEGKDKHILPNRKRVYELAKQKRPERWSGKIRNWEPIQFVCLNPNKKITDAIRSGNQTKLSSLMRQVA